MYSLIELGLLQTQYSVQSYGIEQKLTQVLITVGRFYFHLFCWHIKQRLLFKRAQFQSGGVLFRIIYGLHSMWSCV